VFLGLFVAPQISDRDPQVLQQLLVGQILVVDALGPQELLEVELLIEDLELVQQRPLRLCGVVRQPPV
jgi:hypothetical protein